MRKNKQHMSDLELEIKETQKKGWSFGFALNSYILKNNLELAADIQKILDELQKMELTISDRKSIAKYVKDKNIIHYVIKSFRQK